LTAQSGMTYDSIAAQAKKEGAEIHWGDETGLRSDDVRARGFSPNLAQRRNPGDPRQSQASRPVDHLDRDQHGTDALEDFGGALNSDILIDFLRRLIKGAGQAVALPMSRRAAWGLSSRHPAP